MLALWPTSFEAAEKKRIVKIEGMVPILCYKCGSKNHKSENCPNISFKEQIQQRQLYSTYESSENSSSEFSDEELNMHMNECDCIDSDNCPCQSSTESKISSDEDLVYQPKEKLLMAQTIDDAETKLLS